MKKVKGGHPPEKTRTRKGNAQEDWPRRDSEECRAEGRGATFKPFRVGLAELDDAAPQPVFFQQPVKP
jgi:hypothetical protein